VLNKKNGVFITQAGSADSIPHPTATVEGTADSWCFSPIRNTLATVFDHAIPYTVPMPSFGEDWGYVMAFNGAPALAQTLVDLAPAATDALVEARIEAVPGVPAHRERATGVPRVATGQERGGEVLRHYDGAAHRGMFALSKSLRAAIQSDQRIMTVENPIFMY
jgi:spermidine synthase